MKRLISLNLKISVVIVFAIASFSVYSADVPLKFNTPEQQQRFDYLTKELRCLVCQNQNLAESHAQLAQDLRQQVQQMILKGKTNDQIIKYLVARYGDFVLYNPPLQENTWLLWFGPFILLLAGLFIVYKFVRGRSKLPPPELSAEQQSQLAQLLGKGKK